MEIVNFSITPDTAVANGVDTISANAVIMNGSNYVSNEPVVFNIISGSALFTNGSSSILVLSDSLGAVSASLVDTKAETITVEVALQSNATVYNSLTATFTSSGNTVDTINLLLVINDAKADGEDQNQVELQTLSGAIPVASTAVSVALTNGAVFVSGEKTANITTDSNGRSSLPFTSTTIGESKLTAYLTDNISVYNSVTATFDSASTEIGLVLDVVADNALANGKAMNRVRATVINSDTQKPLSGQAVTFNISSGSATFDNDSASYTVNTDSNGEAYASVKNNVIETVTLSAVVGDKTATTMMQFSENYAPLKIARVYNHNKTFPSGGPSTFWNSGIFYASVTGGSGSYTWKISGDGVYGEWDSSSSATVTFRFDDKELYALGSHTITVTDDITNEQDSYVFNLHTCFTHYADPQLYLAMLVIGFGNCPTTEDLLSLYNDWGNMTPYGFVLDKNWGWYWTSDSNIALQTKVRLVNGEVTTGLDQIIACCYSKVSKV